MFSFFRRKKSQDDGDKREKSKNKEKSGSPFFRRKDPKKTDAGTTAEEQPAKCQSPFEIVKDEVLTNGYDPAEQETYLEAEETNGFDREGYRTPDETPLSTSDIATSIELNCQGKNVDNRFTLPSVFLNPTVDMTVVVRRRTPEPEPRCDIGSEEIVNCPGHATGVETNRDETGLGTVPVDSERGVHPMGTSPSIESVSDGHREVQTTGPPTEEVPDSADLPPENRGTVDDAKGIFEEPPLIDSAVASGESRGEGPTSDDGGAPHSSSDRHYSADEDTGSENGPSDMTYEIEERRKSDASGDSEVAADDSGLNVLCDSCTDMKIRPDQVSTDFLSDAETKFTGGEVGGIDNTEIDGVDIAANNENKSVIIFETPSVSPEPECALPFSEEDEDDEACDNVSGATVENEKMSGVVNEGETDASGKPEKRVRWADIEGGTELCCADDDASSEEESEEEEEDDEDEEKKEDTDPSSSEECSESEAEENDQTKSEVELQEVRPEESPASDHNDSSEEGNEDEERSVNQQIIKAETVVENCETTNSEMTHRDDNARNLCEQISELHHKLNNKTAGMEKLQNELESVYNESELARKRFRRLQDELDECKRCNLDLIDRLNKQPGESASNLGIIEEDQLKEAEERITELERKLLTAREENARLLNSLKKLEKDREQEMRIAQQALEDALEEQNRMETKFGKEFEQLRTLNTNRELKLIDDFEWKLREVEKTCKKQIQDKEKLNDQKMLEVCAKLSAAEAALEKVSHLKNSETELKHLRNITHDQKKSLRTLTRQLEELQVNEKVLQEEINRLRTALDQEKSNFSAIQSLHKEDLAEKDRRLHFRLDMQKNHLDAEWEEKLRRECSRIRIDLERTFREEKRQAIEAAKSMKEQENVQNKYIWENRIQEFKKEAENLKRKLTQKEEIHKNAMENAQSKYDNDLLALRRKMDKLDMSYQEKIEKIQEGHEQALAKLTEECEKKIQQCEVNYQAQVGTTRTTIELVKQQMQMEAEKRIQDIHDSHERELQKQLARLSAEKERELMEMEEKHKETVEQLQNEIAALRKKCGSRDEPQQRQSSSGLGKTFMGLFEKKDPSQKHNKNDIAGVIIAQENRPDRDELLEERKENNVTQMPNAEQPNCTRDAPQKKQGEDKKEAAQKEGANRNQPSQRHHRRSRKSKSGKR